eukprot:COSAG02_NODE_190_length_30025_cov_22.989875_5_plen_102_part_00
MLVNVKRNISIVNRWRTRNSQGTQVLYEWSNVPVRYRVSGWFVGGKFLSGRCRESDLSEWIWHGECIFFKMDFPIFPFFPFHFPHFFQRQLRTSIYRLTSD